MHTLIILNDIPSPADTIHQKPIDSVIGNKGASLVRLYQGGFNVPPAAFVPTSVLTRLNINQTFAQFVEKLNADPLSEIESSCDAIRANILAQRLPPNLIESIQRFIGSYPQFRFAVRSSGTLEDMADSSFAGLYVSLLNRQTLEEIVDAIRTCWASLFGPRVITYCRERSLAINELAMGVVIQQMIPAERSGVSFSVNPTEGHDTQVVTEACWGLGEALVSGQINPNQYIYDWHQEAELKRHIPEQTHQLVGNDTAPFVTQIELDASTQAVLSPSEVKTISQLTVDVQRLYGHPIDIEWAIANGNTYLLQARPITSIRYTGSDTEWTTADFKDGGVSSTVCTPFMWSLYDFIWERTMPAYLEQTRLISSSGSTLWGKMFFGRPYWNLGAVKSGLKRLPGFCERDFDESLGIEVVYDGLGHVTGTNLKSIIVGMNVLYKLNRSFKNQLIFCQTYLPNQLNILQQLDKHEPSLWPTEKLFAFYPQLIETEYWRSESAYFNLIYDNSNVSTLFKDFFDPIQQRNPNVNYLEMISGLTNLSHLKQNQSLWEVTQLLREDATTLNYWKSTTLDEITTHWLQATDVPGHKCVAQHIECFKHNSLRELDITIPRYGEDPRPVFESIQQILRSPQNESSMQLVHKQQQRYLKARQQFLDAIPFWKRRKAARKLEQLRTFLWWREELRDLSTRMYYQVRRFTLILADRLVDINWFEKPDDIFFIPVTDILSILRNQTSPKVIQKMIAQNRCYYDSFRHYQPPNEIGERYTIVRSLAKSSDDHLHGIGCSPGIIEGTAKVVADIFAADRIEAGDILITRFTDPGWTPKFSLLSGVVTETGGMLSHAAVISREYGIPAVLAVNNATERIRDGSRIRVDGNLGTVEVVQ